jgi:pimeloyl-ACP methyl ester carboxylesterase
VGASMGCATVLHAAVHAPHRFDRLVLLTPPRAWETRTDARRAYQAAADQIEREGRDAWAAGLRRLPPPPILADVWSSLADPDIPDAELHITSTSADRPARGRQIASFLSRDEGAPAPPAPSSR